MWVGSFEVEIKETALKLEVLVIYTVSIFF